VLDARCLRATTFGVELVLDAHAGRPAALRFPMSIGYNGTMSDVIGPGQWVQMHYELRDGRGNQLEATDEPVEFVYGYSGLVPGFEEALEGLHQGDAVNITIPPEDAYGTRDETNVFHVDRDEFPEDAEIEVGSEFVAEGEDGTSLTMRITEVNDDHVVVDANHPLAGETLNFQVRVLEVRKATDDELLAAQAEASDTPTPGGEPS
jgi:FKBP-type peptidyl-prolyl cis-trans isomerase SlyD